MITFLSISLNMFLVLKRKGLLGRFLYYSKVLSEYKCIGNFCFLYYSKILSEYKCICNYVKCSIAINATQIPCTNSISAQILGILRNIGHFFPSPILSYDFASGSDTMPCIKLINH